MIATNQFTISTIYDGDQGISVTKVVREYCKSNSPTSLPSSPYWSETEPAISSSEYLWARDRTDLSDGTSEYGPAICSTNISGVKQDIDRVNQSITNKVWSSDITTAINTYDGSTVKTIRDRVSQTEQDISGIAIRVSDVKSDILDLGTRMTSAESTIIQNSNKIAAIVTVNGQSSSFTLTDKMIQAITNQFVVTGSDGTTTVISGGNIQANSISATDLSVDAIKSRNYSDPLDSNSHISTAGTFLDLANGDIYSPILGINTTDKTGKISGLNITESSIYSGNKNAINSKENGFFLDNIGQMNIGDEYNYIASWYDTAEARWKISISADSIMLGTGESVADIAKNASSLVYDQDYEIYDDRVEFEAHLYKNGEDVRNLYDEYSFSWYIKNDNGMSLYGQGYTIEIPIEEFQYGGSVVGRFIDDNLFDIVDNLENTLVSSDEDTIISYRNTLPNR